MGMNRVLNYIWVSLQKKVNVDLKLSTAELKIVMNCLTCQCHHRACVHCLDNGEIIQGFNRTTISGIAS